MSPQRGETHKRAPQGAASHEKRRLKGGVVVGTVRV